MSRRKQTKQTLKIGKKLVKSPFEYDLYGQIEEIVGKKGSVEYEAERLRYTTEHDYIPDFIVKTRTGKTIYIEAKGNGRSFDGPARNKLIAVKQQYPGIDLRIVFYSDGKVGKKRKDGSFYRQSDWATRHNFIFSIRRVPEEWLTE